MVNDNTINRINELSRKMKTVGLSDEEKEEQKKLRNQYVKAFKASLRSQLDSIEFVDEPQKSQNEKK